MQSRTAPWSHSAAGRPTAAAARQASSANASASGRRAASSGAAPAPVRPLGLSDLSRARESAAALRPRPAPLSAALCLMDTGRVRGRRAACASPDCRCAFAMAPAASQLAAAQLIREKKNVFITGAAAFTLFA